MSSASRIALLVGVVVVGSLLPPPPEPRIVGSAKAPALARAAVPPARCTRVNHALRPGAFDQCAEVVQSPKMKRWAPLVWRTVGRDAASFSLVMTFIFVESGGYQFAVSRSGCAGLMQFCDSTALRVPYAQIFDIERLRPCRCTSRRCRVPWRVRRFLETTDASLHQVVAPELPCALSDSRFDPEQAIRAGWTYISQLAEAYEQNIYLMYIGYNSGPPVAERIWRKLGPIKARELPAIGRVLRRALAPSFGRRARRRARALLAVHLPKVQRIHQAYRAASTTLVAEAP